MKKSTKIFKSDLHELNIVYRWHARLFSIFHLRTLLYSFLDFQIGFFWKIQNKKNTDHKYWLISYFIEEISRTHANSGRKHTHTRSKSLTLRQTDKERSRSQLHILSYICENWLFFVALAWRSLIIVISVYVRFFVWFKMLPPHEIGFFIPKQKT